MYGEGWIFDGGKGGLSGGGGSSSSWEWGDIPIPDEEYTYTCEDPLPYLGMVWEEEIVDDEYRFEILMQRKNTPSIGRFSTYSSPAVLDYDEDETGTPEEEEYPYLPVPSNSWLSGEIVFTSSYTSLPLYSLEIAFDGSTYYSPYICDSQQVYPHDIVLEERGQSYLDGLSGDYEGTIRLWQYYYQRTRIQETDMPAAANPRFGAGLFSPPPVFSQAFGSDFITEMSFLGVRRTG